MWTYSKTQVFLWWNLLNGLLLKKIGRCTTFLVLRVKVTSYACLERSRLKLIFHWKAHSFISSKSAESCFAAAFFGSLIIVNKEVSSAKSFGFKDFQSDRLKAVVRESNLKELCTPPKNTNCSQVQNNKSDWNNNSRSWKIFRWKMIGLHGINEVGGILLKINEVGRIIFSGAQIAKNLKSFSFFTRVKLYTV